MKQSNLFLALALLCALPNVTAQEKRFKETIKKEVKINPEEGEFIVKNVFGSITIEGYSGSSVMLEVERTITADSNQDLEKGKEELQFKVVTDGNRIIARPDAPYITFNNKNLGFNWCNSNGYDDIGYEHHLDFKIKVPKGISIQAGTVNDGEISIANFTGKKIKVSNVNGGIELNNVSGTTNLHCINGDVSVSYTKNPNADSKYYSLNGDMNISYQNGLSANVSFKSMNGDLFTDFDIEKQYSKSKRTVGDDKAKFKYEAKPIMQIAGGAIALDFETLNGNVYLKKI